ncbi:hypothetical protein KAU32_10770 [bacterium]|nr:hypothetical protein [bacterium]
MYRSKIAFLLVLIIGTISAVSSAGRLAVRAYIPEAGLVMDALNIYKDSRSVGVLELGLGGFLDARYLDDSIYVIHRKGLLIFDEYLQLKKRIVFKGSIIDVIPDSNSSEAWLIYSDKLALYDLKSNEKTAFKGEYIPLCLGDRKVFRCAGKLYKAEKKDIVPALLNSCADENEFSINYYFGDRHYILDINGDVYLNGRLFLEDRNVRSIVKVSAEQIVFLGDGVFDISGDLISTPHKNYVHGQIYATFSNGSGLIVSTFENGVFSYSDNKWARWGDGLVSAFINGKAIFRTMDGEDFSGDEILRASEHYIFGVNGIYDMESKLFVGEDEFYFSDMLFKRGLVSSYRSGLYALSEEGLTSVKAPFRGISKMVELEDGTVYILSDEGLYTYKAGAFEKLQAIGLTTDIRIDTESIFVSIYEKGIYRLHGGKFIKTPLSIPGLNCDFTNESIVCELYRNIFVVKNEVLK